MLRESGLKGTCKSNEKRASGRNGAHTLPRSTFFTEYTRRAAEMVEAEQATATKISVKEEARHGASTKAIHGSVTYITGPSTKPRKDQIGHKR